MSELSLAPSSTSTARALRTESAQYATQRAATEVDALWRLTEELGSLMSHPGAALELVTRTAGELTHAEAAAILLHPGHDIVLASRWGIVGIPLGYKSPDVRRTLDTTWAATTSMPIRSGSHDIGCVWIARTTPAFAADERRVLQTLASVTSLALPTLIDAGKLATSSHPVAPAVEPAPVRPAAPGGIAHAPVERHRMAPETMRMSVFPPSLAELLRAIDAGDDIDGIAAILHTEPVLTALVIRAGNCAAAGRARPARSVREAVLSLGMQRLRTLALVQFTRTLVSGPHPLNAWLWEQAIGTAVRAHELLLATDRHADAEAGRLAGLLQPMGSIALATAHPERYARILRTAIRDDRPLTDVEREAFGIDAATLTQQLLHAWHLAPSGRGDAECGIRWAVGWAMHVSLAANPMWQQLVAEDGRSESPTWVSQHIAEAEHALQLTPELAARVAASSEAALTSTRQLISAST